MLGGSIGQTAGVIILAKQIDSTVQANITKQLQSQSLQVNLINYGSYVNGVGNETVYGDRSSSQGTMVEDVGNGQVTGLSVVDDIDGRPALIVQVTGPRTLYDQAIDSESMLLIALGVLSIILFVMTVFLLHFFIISRIDRLNDDVKKIEENGNGNEKIKVLTNDELGSLAASINRMVTSFARPPRRTSLKVKGDIKQLSRTRQNLCSDRPRRVR